LSKDRRVAAFSSAHRRRYGGGIALALALAAASGACRSHGGTTPVDAGAMRAAPSAAPSGSTPAAAVEVDAGPMASGIPLPAASVEAELNPRHVPAYSGPTGSIEGVVHVSGDQAPKQDVTVPFQCGEAYGTYGKAFREGNGRTLGDVLVAVTDYDGLVAARGDVSPVTIRGCAYDKRTLALEFGQRIEVRNADATQFFLPTLLGAEMPAQIVAVPRGDAVKLYPLRVGHYVLADGMNRTWMYADVFVLKYTTHAVTGLDGHFRIDGIPVGKAKVSAYLPAIDVALHPDVGVENPTVDRKVEIKAGQATTVDFVIPYKVPKHPVEKQKRPEGPVIR
jgi:hypothetical protein